LNHVTEPQSPPPPIWQKLGVRSALPFLALAAVFLFAQSEEAHFHKLREDMVRTQLAGWRWGFDAVDDALVLEAFRQVPRHRFVADALVPHAYEDRPLPIGYGQTISQPYIVAKMTELVEPRKGHRALEIGTGSGYQAAILSRLVADVYTIEIIEPLGVTARERLAALGYRNVEVRVGDGYHGWSEKAPFDCIVVTAAANHVPPPLIEQLKPGGRLVVPIGNPFQTQRLVLVTKGSKGPRDIRVQDIMAVSFVPLVSGSGGQ
jgi:protein-L-isoaspartate(D-aspartate) O-methyltransferase